jgi:ketosteroid isomerase-like protein
MERSDLQGWLDRYLEAWRLNEAEAIEALFTEDAVYRFRPFSAEGEIAIGRAAIVEQWLREPDDPSGWVADYEVFAVDGDRGVATGTSHYYATTYRPDRLYYNCFLMRFDAEGKCAEFTEFFMAVPDHR